MPLPILVLDDIEFEQLFEEARALIPRYAPEWTDHNEHDPGITLLELLAWIVDQQIYQVGFVSDRHLRAFAALLGVRPKAAIPAHGLVWPNKLLLTEKDLKRGEKINCVQQPDISFLLDADTHITSANISDLTVNAKDNSKEIILTNFSRQPLSSFIFQAEIDNYKTLEIAFDQPLVREGQYPIALGIEISSIHQSTHADARTSWGPLFIEYQTDLAPWQRVSIVEDGTFSLARTGIVLLKIPPNNEAKSSKLRLRFDLGYFPLPIQIVRLELNVLPIVQLEERSAKVIDRSNGLPNQVFSVDVTGLPDQSVDFFPTGHRTNKQNSTDNQSLFSHPFQIEIAEDGNLTKWTSSDDLSKGKPNDRIYYLDTTANTIAFGNGINGKIPAKDTQIQSTAYQLTKGADGNFAAGLSWRIPGAALQGDIYGINTQPVAGGENAWDIDRLLQEARKRILNRQVILSDRDVENKVKSLNGFGVARVDVLPRYHPALTSKNPEAKPAPLPGARTVLVTPWHEENDFPNIEKYSRYVQEVKAAIDDYRVLGERLSVIFHQRVPIDIDATLLIVIGKDGEKIKKEAISRLKNRLTVFALEDTNTNYWPLGRPVTLGEIKALLSAIPDVVAVTNCLLAREGAPLAEQDIRLNCDEVATVTDGNIHITIDFLLSR